ncbi:MAG: beta-N-acetylhexosaminidase, partial [Chitinophagaceae bacterium]|nr:beta-N-acetylhexosaminidase [Chitinophagaceae bacterium]
MRLTISFCLLLLTSITSAQQVNIIPQPAVVKLTGEGTGFNITASTVIVLQGSGLEKTAAYLNDYLQKFYLIKLKVVTNSASTNAIRLNYERLEKEQPGAYIMTVDEKGIYIGGDNASGTFNGIQTLIQLLPVPDLQLKKPGTSLKIPFLYIEDTPRFAYRGMHLDVARHFQPVSFVKKYIDYLALHKIN